MVFMATHSGFENGGMPTKVLTSQLLLNLHYLFCTLSIYLFLFIYIILDLFIFIYLFFIYIYLLLHLCTFSLLLMTYNSLVYIAIILFCS